MSELNEDIAAKSDQMNAVDLVAPLTVTVTKFERKKGDQQPWSVHTDGHPQPWKPCKTMRRLLLKYWGDDPRKWVGQQLRLYCEPDCRYAGKQTDGIRVSGMSGIDAAFEYSATEWKGSTGQKSYPIEKLDPKPVSVLDQWRPKFKGAPPAVLAVAKQIADGTADESFLRDVDDPTWQVLLTEFRDAVQQ